MQTDENEHDAARDEIPSEQLIRHNKEGSRCHMMNKNPNVAHIDVPKKQLISIQIKVSLSFIYFYDIIFWDIAMAFRFAKTQQGRIKMQIDENEHEAADDEVPREQLINK